MHMICERPLLSCFCSGCLRDNCCPDGEARLSWEGWPQWCCRPPSALSGHRAPRRLHGPAPIARYMGQAVVRLLAATQAGRAAVDALPSSFRAAAPVLDAAPASMTAAVAAYGDIAPSAPHRRGAAVPSLAHALPLPRFLAGMVKLTSSWRSSWTSSPPGCSGARPAA